MIVYVIDIVFYEFGMWLSCVCWTNDRWGSVCRTYWTITLYPRVHLLY